jgi:CHAT domain-containing protein/tetratricopeptide (TPR) repeat protein
MPKRPRCCLLLLTAVASLALSAPAQSVLSAAGDHVALRMHPGQSQTVEVTGAAGSLRLLEVELAGGLIYLEPSQGFARVLDLGRGSHFRYAIEIGTNGSGTVQFRSAEHLRDAELTVVVATEQPSQSTLQHLRTAQIEFAKADAARRNLPEAPNTADALTSYDHAAEEARAAGDLTLLGWILDQKARFLLFRTSNFVASRRVLHSAAELPMHEEPAIEALTYKTLSSCASFMGNMEEAIAAGEHALALYKETGDIYWQGVVLGNLIGDYEQAGRNEEATRAGRGALTDAELSQDTAGVVFSLTELADVYRLEGNPQAAFEAFREAEKWSQDIRYAPLIEANIEQALGEFYMDMGLWDEARRQFEQCLRRAAPDSPAALEARTFLAQTLAHLRSGPGAVARALAEYGTAIETAQRLKLAPEETALRIERSALLLDAGQLAQARQDAQRAQQEAEAQKNAKLRVGAALATAAVERRNCRRTAGCETAEAAYKQAIGLMQNASEHVQEAIAYAGLARIYRIQGRDESALRSVEYSLNLVENSRASLSSSVLAASYFEEWRDWYALAEHVALDLDRAHPGTGYQEIAFRYSERARARAMLDAIGSRGQRRASAASPSLARQTEVNKENIQKDELRLLETGSAQVAASLQHLFREQDELSATSATPGEGAPSNPGPIASLTDVQRKLLTADSSLIAIALASDRTYCWIITPSSVRVRLLPGGEQLRRMLSPLRAMLVERAPAPQPDQDATRYAEQIRAFDQRRDSLLRQAGDLLLAQLPVRTKHLYVVADGGLSSLPWGALRIPCGASECYAVERFSISIEPSASIAVELASRSAPLGRSTMLVVSDTVGNEETLSPRWKAMGGLPGSRREAQQIARVAPPDALTMLSGPNATPAALRSSLNEMTAILHVATHTLLVPNHPELSGIALSPDRSSSDHGILWLHDIPSLHAPPLVTLSGCATQGNRLDQEDLSTLAQAFFYAGAQQVVASLWDVDDNSTATLMGKFYRNLLQLHLDAAESLRLAQLQMIAAHADLSDWAAFTINGSAAHSMSTQAGAK